MLYRCDKKNADEDVSKQTCCFTSTEARWLIRNGKRVGRGGGERERASGSSSQSDPQKTEEAVDHRQNNYVKEVGTSPVRSN